MCLLRLYVLSVCWFVYLFAVTFILSGLTTGSKALLLTEGRQAMANVVTSSKAITGPVLTHEAMLLPLTLLMVFFLADCGRREKHSEVL